MYSLPKRKFVAVGCFVVLFFTYITRDNVCVLLPERTPTVEEERMMESKIEQEIRDLISEEMKTVLQSILHGDYILNSPRVCAGLDKPIALIIVNTMPGHFERRQNIRSTYGSSNRFHNKVRVLFLIGKVENKFLRDAILQEHNKYKDTVQGNFIDSYHNLTYKGVMGFRWITEYCSHVKYVVKVDDDVVLNMWRFLDAFERRIDSKSIICQGISRPMIQKTDTWNVYKDNFQTFKRWPFDYCKGFVLILTSDAIVSLLKSVYNTPFLRIDDVYLYGLLPYKAGNVTLLQLPESLKVTSDADESEKCLIKKGVDCEYFAVSIGYKENNFSFFWFLIEKRNGFQ